MKKSIFFIATAFLFFFYSCSDFKDLGLPESVSVTTAARFEAPLGNGALSIREKASLEKLKDILEKNISSNDDSSENHSPSVYEYNPTEKDDAVLQYILNYPLKEIPISIDDGNDGKTDVSNISIPETKFEAPDINDSIYNSLKDALAAVPGHIDIPEGVPGNISEIPDDKFSNKKYVEFTITTPVFTTMNVKNGKMNINIKTPAGVSSDFVMTVGAKIVRKDDHSKLIAPLAGSSETKTVSTTANDITTISIDLAGAELVKEMHVIFEGTLAGGTLGNTNNYTVSMEPSSDFSISKITGLTMTNAELGANGTVPVKKEFEFNGLNESLKEAAVEKGELDFYCKLPEGWSGIKVDESYFVIDGGIEIANTDFSSPKEKAGFLLYKTADLAGKIVKSPASIAPRQTSTYKSDSDYSYIKISLENATLIFGDEEPNLSINGDLRIESLSSLTIQLGDLNSFTGSEDTGLNFSTLLSDILKGEKSALIDDFEFTSTSRASLLGYIFASQPTNNAALTGLSLSGKIYAKYDSKTEPDTQDIMYLIGDGSSDAEILLKSSAKTLASVAKEGIITDSSVFASENISAAIPSSVIENLINQKPDNLCVEYNLGLTSGTASELTLTGDELKSLDNKPKISVSLALVLPFQMKLLDNADIPELGKRDNVITIADAKSLIKEKDADEKDEDLLSRDEAKDSEKWLKYADALKACTMEYTVDNNLLVNQAADGDVSLPIKISLYAVNENGETVTWFGDEANHEKPLDSTTGTHSFEFTKAEVRTIFENYPFIPKVKVEIPADGSVSHAARNSKFGIKGTFRIEFDRNIPVEVWSKND